jgi:hypothetical protein
MSERNANTRVNQELLELIKTIVLNLRNGVYNDEQQLELLDNLKTVTHFDSPASDIEKDMITNLFIGWYVSDFLKTVRENDKK